jgi:hypothetical protein
MMSKSPKKKLARPKRILRLPDLDHAKVAVLNTLSSPDSQRSYRFAIDDFIAWYCSEPRLALNKTVVLRYKLQLEARHLASSTINLRLAAVRRLAYEAADTGLLSPELAAGIRRVKGAKKLGVRLGNWLSSNEAKALLDSPDVQTVRGKRSRGILAVCLGCGLRRCVYLAKRLDRFEQIADRLGFACPAGRQETEFRLKFLEPMPHDTPTAQTVGSQHQPSFITMTDHENRSDTTVVLEHVSEIFRESLLGEGLYNGDPLLREHGLDEPPESATEVKPVSRKFPKIALDDQQVSSGLPAPFDLPRPTLRPLSSRSGFSA